MKGHWKCLSGHQEPSERHRFEQAFWSGRWDLNHTPFAGSALKPASRLPLRGSTPSCAPHERGSPPFGIPCRGLQIPHDRYEDLERAMGFEPTTTSLGS